MTLIHPTAVVHPDAQLHPTVRVGAYAEIGANVKIGSETTIGSHAIVQGWTEIGSQNQIFPGAVIGFEPQDLKYNGAPSLVKIGNGNKIREYVTINRATNADEATVIGDRNLLMAYVHIAHNCILEDRVAIANSVSLAGHVYVESRATIGGVLGIHQFARIGKLAMVGGMSRVERDIPPFMLVEGHPCRVRALNQVGIKRAGLESSLPLLKKAFRLLYRSGIPLKEALEKLQTLSDDEQVNHLYQFLQGSLMSHRRGVTAGRKRSGELSK